MEFDRVLVIGSFKIKEWILFFQIVFNEFLWVVLRKFDEEKFDESLVVLIVVNLDGEKGVKILGVGWNFQIDVLSFDVKEINIVKLIKRVVLFNILRLYDFFGLVLVVIIKVRIVL